MRGFFIYRRFALVSYFFSLSCFWGFYNSLRIFVAPVCNKCAPDNLKTALALEFRFNTPKISSRSATKTKRGVGY